MNQPRNDDGTFADKNGRRRLELSGKLTEEEHISIADLKRRLRESPNRNDLRLELTARLAELHKKIWADIQERMNSGEDYDRLIGRAQGVAGELRRLLATLDDREAESKMTLEELFAQQSEGEQVES